MAIASAKLFSQLQVIETLDDVVGSLGSGALRQVTHNGFDETLTLTATSTPNATEVAGLRATLIAGALTLDLAALTVLNGAVKDYSGLELRQAKFKALVANAGSITISPGAVNGYSFLGAAGVIPLAPGQSIAVNFAAAAPAVAGADKTIDLAGTGTDSLDVLMTFGTP